MSYGFLVQTVRRLTIPCLAAAEFAGGTQREPPTELSEGIPCPLSIHTKVLPALVMQGVFPKKLTAFLDGLIRIVSTVIIDITLPGLRDTAAIVTPKLAWLAGPAGTVRTVFVRVVLAVIHGVTLPGLWDAAFVGTLPFIGLAPVVHCKGEHLVISLHGIKNESSCRAQ